MKDRKIYMKDYRINCGELMKQQVREWRKQHTDYFNKWRQLHPGYHKAWQMKNHDHYCEYQEKWRKQHHDQINFYMREYMRQYRNNKRC